MNNKELSEWGKLIKKYQEFVCPAVREGQKKGIPASYFYKTKK
ncbi:MAG: hypothetical protein ACK5NU_16380 [Fusobacterium ulcerans]|jgi:hypothetical protein